MWTSATFALALVATTFGEKYSSPINIQNFLCNKCCILGFPQKGAKILGGSSAKLGEIPWQVSIQALDGSHLCGGTIISEEWILTATQCSQ
jgi:hypothetical protein